MDLNSYLIFVSIAFLYIVSPGPAVFISINYGATQGIKKTLCLILGNSTGLAILATISALGIGILITSSYALLSIVKILGAIVLFYMGIKILYSTFKSGVAINLDKGIEKTNLNKNMLSLYREGLLLSLTNPKALIFFSAIFPQFLDSNENSFMNMMILGVTFVSISFTCLSCYSIFGKFILSKVLNNKGLKILNTITGLLFVGMSGTLVFSDLKLKHK